MECGEGEQLHKILPHCFVLFFNQNPKGLTISVITSKRATVSCMISVKCSNCVILWSDHAEGPWKTKWEEVLWFHFVGNEEVLTILLYCQRENIWPVVDPLL